MQTTIPELLSAQADALTTKPFMQVWAEGEGIVLTLSFSEFRRRVQCAAAALRQQAGVTAGQRAAMLSHPSVGCFVYSTAIMWLGAVAVQLNWRQPIEMLLSMMKTAEAPGALLASPIFCAEARSLRGGARGPRVFWLQRPPDASADEGASLLPAVDGVHLEESLPAVGHVAVAPGSDALIMFTSGSTSAPKGVPLTHAGLLWNCAQKLRGSKGAFAHPTAGTLSLLPNFHVIGFTNNFLFNLFAGVRCAVHRDADTKPLTADRMIDACAALRPTVLDTVPFLAEEMIKRLDAGDPAASCLQRLDFILAGGAPLNQTLLLPLLTRGGVRLWPHYGQTELGGPALLGGLDGDLCAMRPPPGTRWMLVRDDGGEAMDEGELVLLGMGCATRGYLGDPNATRRLTGGLSTSTQERFHTGDVFRRALVDGVPSTEWLVHVCRQDDLILHSTGEMTNPLPIEEALLASCAEHVAKLCVIGKQRASPYVALQPCNPAAHATDVSQAHVARAVNALNTTLPSYSRIPPHALLWLESDEPPLATSAKGNVIRGEAERRFAERMVMPSRAEVDEGGEDSISLTVSAAHRSVATDETPMTASRGHMMFVCMVGVMLHHFTTPLWQKQPTLALLKTAFPITAMPTFVLLAGMQDVSASPSTLLKLVQQAATLLVLGAISFYCLPHVAVRLCGQMYDAEAAHLMEWWRSKADGKSDALPPDVLRNIRKYAHAHNGEMLMHVWTFQWFFFVLALYKLTRAAVVIVVDVLRKQAGLRVSASSVLAGLALLAHFASGAHAPWPLVRNPESWLPAANAMYHQEADHTIPMLNKLAPLWPFYAVMPLLLPADFPASLPLQATLAMQWGVSSRLARLAWVLVAVAVLWAHLNADADLLSDFNLSDRAAILTPKQGNLFNLSPDYSPMMLAYSCKELYFRPFKQNTCVDGVSSWRLFHMLHDAVHMLLVLACIIGLGALSPRRGTLLSRSGSQTLYCYMLHVPLTPLICAPLIAGIFEAIAPDPNSVRRALVMLCYVAFVQLALSRKPSLPSIPLIPSMIQQRADSGQSRTQTHTARQQAGAIASGAATCTTAKRRAAFMPILCLLVVGAMGGLAWHWRGPSTPVQRRPKRAHAELLSHSGGGGKRTGGGGGVLRNLARGKVGGERGGSGGGVLPYAPGREFESSDICLLMDHEPITAADCDQTLRQARASDASSMKALNGTDVRWRLQVLITCLNREMACNQGLRFIFPASPSLTIWPKHELGRSRTQRGLYRLKGTCKSAGTTLNKVAPPSLAQDAAQCPLHAVRPHSSRTRHPLRVLPQALAEHLPSTVQYYAW